MDHDRPGTRFARCGALLVAGALLAVLAVVVAREGWTVARFGLFTATATVSVAGVHGVAFGRPPMAVAAGLAIVAVGAFQETLGVLMVPAGLLLVFAGLLTADDPVPVLPVPDR